MSAAEIRFVDLDAEQSRAILARNHVGRLAYCVGNRVDVRPLHYVFDDAWLWCRTSDGEKIARLRRNWWVAFEVDEVDETFRWRSVVVHGGFYPLASGGAATNRAHYERALTALRRFLPATLAPDDPVPDRRQVFGIAIQEVSGRMAMPHSTAPSEQAGALSVS